MAEWLDDHEECDRQIAALTQERDALQAEIALHDEEDVVIEAGFEAFRSQVARLRSRLEELEAERASLRESLPLPREGDE